MKGVTINDEEKWMEELKECIERAGRTTKSFQEILNEIIIEKKITREKFWEKTHLDPKNLSNWKTGKTPPNFNNFTTFCIAFEIDILTAVAMRQALGLCFDFKNKQHCIYYHLITDYSGRSIYDCNRILQRFGIDKKYWLGGNEDKIDYEED